MSFIFGGGGGGGGGAQPTSGTQVSIAREAPEIEARKLSLYDQALKLSSITRTITGLSSCSSPTFTTGRIHNLAGHNRRRCWSFNEWSWCIRRSSNVSRTGSNNCGSRSLYESLSVLCD